MSLTAAQFQPAGVMRVRCHYCSHFRSGHEVIYSPGGVVMCWHCYEWHGHALDVLAGNPPPGCQECGLMFEELAARTPDGDCKMYVHPRDGLYAVLCKQCSDAYVLRRVDLYGPTQFGHKLNL